MKRREKYFIAIVIPMFLMIFLYSAVLMDGAQTVGDIPLDGSPFNIALLVILVPCLLFTLLYYLITGFNNKGK